MTQKIVYPAVFEYEGGVIGVTFPDLPGCVSAGDNEAQAFDNARDALLFHLEGMIQDGDKFPEPRSVAKVKTGKGEVSVLIDVVSPEKQERVNITARSVDLARIDERARAAGMNRSAFMVRSALMGEIGEKVGKSFQGGR